MFKMSDISNLKIAYFGGEPIGVPVLKELMACGIKPQLVICNPDRPSGRGQKLTPPPLKVFAEENDIEVFQPESVKDKTGVGPLTEKGWDLFVVVAYNHLMPSWLIELPKYKTINVHPSMLPLRRGPNPIRSAIIEDDRASIGVSIMLMDEEMDHGPLLTQNPLPIADEHWPIDGRELDQALANLGGALLADTIPRLVDGEITPAEQNHEQATYTQKMNKADGEIDINPFDLPVGEEARNIYKKIQGYTGFPGTFFFHNDSRIKINEAKLINNQLRLVRITPEGKNACSFDQWLPNSN